MTINSVADIIALKEEAMAAAAEAAKAFYAKHGNEDWGSCGFAWVNIYEYNGKKLDGRSKMGKMMKAAGIEQDWSKAFNVWNPSRMPVQNIDTLEAGARAFAEVFKAAGFTAYAGSRLD